MPSTRQAIRRQALFQETTQPEETEDIQDDPLPGQDSDELSALGGEEEDDQQQRADNTTLTRAVEELTTSLGDPQDDLDLRQDMASLAGQPHQTEEPLPPQGPLPPIRIPARAQKGKGRAPPTTPARCSPVMEDEERAEEESRGSYMHLPSRQGSPRLSPPEPGAQPTGEINTSRHSSRSQTLGRRPRQSSEPRGVGQSGTQLSVSRADLELILFDFQEAILEKVKELQRPRGKWSTTISLHIRSNTLLGRSELAFGSNARSNSLPKGALPY
jgi:hypothetical protein